MPVLTRDAAIQCFNGIAEIASILNVTPSAVRMWPDGIAPRGAAAELCAASGGRLQFDSAAYNEYRRPNASQQTIAAGIRDAKRLVNQAEDLTNAANRKVEAAQKIVAGIEKQIGGQS